MHKLIRITTVPVSLKILLKGQLRYMSRFFEVQAISSDGDELADVEDHENVPVTVVNMTRSISPLRDAVALFRLYRIFRRERPDIVHTHTPKAGLLGMLASYFARVPVRLHTVAGMPLMETKGVRKQILIFTEKVTYACAHRVFPNSMGLSEFIRSNKLCSEYKIKVIGNGSSNGINTNYYSPNFTNNLSNLSLRLKNELGFDNSALVYCFIGRMTAHKGLTELIEAFRTLYKEFGDKVKLLLIGPYEEGNDALSNELRYSISNHKGIIHPGRKEDVRPYLLISDVFVFPSYREGFPNVVLQAGAMGLPVIASDINGCNEIIKDGENGLLIKPKDSVMLLNTMRHLLENPNVRENMAKKARRSITNRYKQNVMWENLLVEYTETLKLR